MGSPNLSRIAHRFCLTTGGCITSIFWSSKDYHHHYHHHYNHSLPPSSSAAAAAVASTSSSASASASASASPQDKALEILMYHHRGVGQKWKFVYSYFIWQPFYMLNFYDTSYSFCDEEYFPYQTKLREILMYHHRGVGQKWKFVYSYFIWQPFYMLNFYDTLYSFCDEEYFPYQTKL